MHAPDVPQFALYGENPPDGATEVVHIELIETRSQLYDWHIANHTHRGLFQLLFLFRGRVLATIDDEEWNCKGPTVITIHPSVVHGFDFSRQAQGYVLTLDQGALFGSKADERTDLFAPLFLQPLEMRFDPGSDLPGRIETLLKQMMAEFSAPLNGHGLMLDWLARCVLMLLLRQQKDHDHADVAGRADFDTFSRFRALVDTHYRAQWSTGQYAAQLNMTESRLNRLCLRLGGKSAFDMTQQRLMLEARRKLTYVPASVSSIAYELGYQDPAYFSRAFKRHCGMTPKQFRMENSEQDA